MAKKESMKKDKYIGARVDVDMEDKISAYLATADMEQADLIRKAVREYMLNHPLKQEHINQINVVKPGE